MATNRSVPASEFDAAIDQLASEMTLQDPDRLIAPLQANPSATVSQLRRLWEVAVARSVLADVQRASGDGSLHVGEWQGAWSEGARALRKALVEAAGGDTIDETLSTYWEESLAVRAYPPFASRVRRPAISKANRADFRN